MASRRKARILAFQALYAHELSGTSLDELCSLSWLEPEKLANIDEESLVFTKLLIMGTVEKLADVDAAIKRHLDRWDFNRISRVDLSILRLGAYSLRWQRDVPASITIDEAVEIAKEYGSDDSYKFVNGILDSIRKESEPGKA